MDSEQLYLHSQVQDNVASLEDQSQQIAGEDFMISCYLLVFFSSMFMFDNYKIFNSFFILDACYVLWIICQKYSS